MKIHSYVVARDYGFAPNPFFGVCTLATCKPRIRSVADTGDWVVGTGSKRRNRDKHIVYAMRVTDKLAFEQYWTNPRFQTKKPNLRGSKKQAFGDNIYSKDSKTGLPLAHALKHQIEALGWLEDFYDVDDLPPGRNWVKELERGVGSSLIVMLRTEAYDSRPWCQQEVLWADEYATPAVLVDARTGLAHPAAVLPFDRVPSARIADGNLIRILSLALREGLKFLLFLRRVEQMKLAGSLPSPVALHVFSYAPSMAALLRACNDLSASKEPSTTPRLILYPDPPLRAGHYEAAQALVDLYAPSGTRLVTPNTLAATKGATP